MQYGFVTRLCIDFFTPRFHISYFNFYSHYSSGWALTSLFHFCLKIQLHWNGTDIWGSAPASALVVLQLRCSPQLSGKRAAGASYYHSLASHFNSSLQAQHPAHDPTKSFPFPFSVRSGTGLTSVCLPKSFLQRQLAQLITQVVCTPYKNQSKSQKVSQYRNCSKKATTDPQAPFPLQQLH